MCISLTALACNRRATSTCWGSQISCDLRLSGPTQRRSSLACVTSYAHRVGDRAGGGSGWIGMRLGRGVRIPLKSRFINSGPPLVETRYSGPSIVDKRSSGSPLIVSTTWIRMAGGGCGRVDIRPKSGGSIRADQQSGWLRRGADGLRHCLSARHALYIL